MNVKLRVLTAGVLFFTGQAAFAQKKASDSTKDKEAKIEEVVILGYSKTATKAKDVTASTTVSPELLENRPNASFMSNLQGTAPGVTVSTSSGSPGSAKIDVIVRGVSSLNALTDPLYVIDGLQTNATEYRNLNPNDIESISILRDAAGTSIYGNRGANGVVVIKTKQGRYGSAFKISYDATTGVSFMPNHDYNMADTKQILTLERAANVGKGMGLTDEQINSEPVNTNWRKQFFNADVIQQHNLGLTFGGENVTLYSSLGYMQQGGLVPTTDFKRMTFRNNLNGKSKDGRFNYSAQVALGFSRRNQLDEETNTGINANVVQNPLLGSIIGLPYLAAGLYPTGNDLFNAIQLNTAGGKRIWVLEDVLKPGNMPSRYDQTSIFANAFASYKLTDDLTLGNRIGVDYKVTDRLFARSPNLWLSRAVAAQSATTAVPNPYGGLEILSNTRDLTFNNIVNLNYNKTLGEKHTLDVGLYFDYLKAHYLLKTQQRNGLDPKTWSPGSGAGYIGFNDQNPTFYLPSASAGKVDAGTLAYFATVDYDYDSKYGFSGVIRRDGTYRFAEDYRWATFYSVAGRWNLDQESFMQGSTFDLLKLRASYGTQGNQNLIPPAQGNNPIFTLPNATRTLNSVTTGYNNTLGSLSLSSIGIADLRWEKISQFNVGLDFRLLGRKLEGNFDYYIKDTRDLYNTINVSAATTSIYSFTGNNGKLRNTGVELLLRYHLINNENTKLSFFANGSYNKNTIRELAVEQKTGSLINRVGGTAYEWNLVPYVGVNESNGNMLFLDANGNVTESPTENDRRATGKSYLPKWQGGFGLNAAYKGFFLDALFSYQAGLWKSDNQLTWLYDPTSLGEYNLSADLLNSWTPENTHTSMPALNATNTGLDGDSDRYLFNASFVKLKAVTFGYTVPKSFLNSSFIKSLKIFVQGENLAWWSKWRGFDPEGLTTYSVSVYPNPRTVSIGANVEF
ncbi:SusC/RagA family TonB-linked outer membrane protein [Chryseobacterium nematophagum]|uniref:SusC/RagA family TonB-linked outer membrane protein n=1 Tax=Chryseobacterium nematophagum TaxID=2305228 RepID=A0A3M7LG26_9FLAO|nr:SusC/RagA family TonB-linked outer membrane protein [Chryseobacterium nematophagum]RMZ61064.1 SusC/RagA family TonB-linked outer membrane protein [Chryseobacterium nematophagum]